MASACSSSPPKAARQPTRTGITTCSLTPKSPSRWGTRPMMPSLPRSQVRSATSSTLSGRSCTHSSASTRKIQLARFRWLHWNGAKARALDHQLEHTTRIKRCSTLFNSQSSCLQRGQGMARKNVTSASGSPGCALRMSNRSIAGSDDDTNDIDQQSRDRQHPKQRYLRQGHPKQSVQRVAARSDKSDSETGNRQRQGIFNTAREKEAVFPMTSGRHGHRSENACRAQWREEA